MAPTRTSTTTAEAASGTSAAGRRVLVAFHEPGLGGATLSVLRLVPLLESRGWRFAFWVPRPSEIYEHLVGEGHYVGGADRNVSYSMRALRLPPGPRARLASMPRYFDALARFVRSTRPALAHVNSLFTLAEGTLIRALGVPTLFHIHEMIRPTVKDRAARRVLRTIGTEVVAVSSAGADRLALGAWRPRLVHECAPIPAEVPARAGRDGRLLVGTVGVISRRKGSDLFVEAARIVRERDPGIEFRMVGSPTDPLDAEWAEGVLAQAAEVGVEHVPRADVPAQLADWDVFALPSRRDPFPIAMLEAMGSGLPVVGARADGGIEEQLAGGCGVLVEPDSAHSLAEAILRLRESPAERRRLGEAARRRVAEAFTLEHQAEGIDRAYRSALAGRPAAAG
jgi:glycosyltransferase involved in cell wall biosynthesis